MIVNGKSYIVNPDKIFIANFKERIKLNDGFCPCKVGKKETNKCPCFDFRNTGDCVCGLYIPEQNEGRE